MTHTILVVDDQEPARNVMAELLIRHHYAVELAANGKEAIERLCDGQPLPALVIVISGSAAMRDAIVVPASVTFVTKPVQPDEIMKVVAAMLEDRALAGAPIQSDAEVARASDRVDTEPHVATYGPTPVNGGDVYRSPSMIP